MVSATLALKAVMTTTPRKSKTAAIKIALRGCIALVATQEAIAFGESVQPLTKITPSVSITVIVNGRLVVNCVMKSENVIVIFDDISLDPGKMRIRRKGSDGGHNGIKNIIYLSGSDRFPRIKLGVGHKPEKWDLADWVLSRFSEDEYKLMLEAADKACDAVSLMISGQTDKAMNLFNS